MTSAKYTPGPWRAVEPTAIDYRTMQIQTDESLIAVCCGGGPKRGISAPEGRANAHLIAAAPDLVEALNALTPFLDDLDDATGAVGVYPEVTCSQRCRDAVAKARAALSKAGV